MRKKKERISLKKWWLLKRICDKSVWNLFGPVKAAAWLWLAQAWFRFDLVLFDFEEVWKARDNRTQEKVLERNPMSRINVRHLVLALRGSERFELLSGVCWCLVPAVGSQGWFVFAHPGSVVRVGLLERGCWAIPPCWNPQEKTPPMETEGFLWKEGRNCSIT